MEINIVSGKNSITERFWFGRPNIAIFVSKGTNIIVSK